MRKSDLYCPTPEVHWVLFSDIEHPVETIFPCIKTVKSNVKQFGYKRTRLTTSTFLCILLVIVSGTKCTVYYVNLILSAYRSSALYVTLLFCIYRVI